jgi:hypothetical protein
MELQGESITSAKTQMGMPRGRLYLFASERGFSVCIPSYLHLRVPRPELPSMLLQPNLRGLPNQDHFPEQSRSQRIAGRWVNDKLRMRSLLLAARGIQGRSGKSCRLRWCNQLNPQVKRKPFTDEEDAKIIAAHAEHGNKWATIARLLPGRCGHWMNVMYCFSLGCTLVFLWAQRTLQLMERRMLV